MLVYGAKSGPVWVFCSNYAASNKYDVRMVMLVEKDRPRMAAVQQLVYHICPNGQDDRKGDHHYSNSALAGVSFRHEAPYSASY